MGNNGKLEFRHLPGIIDPQYLKQYDCREVEMILKQRNALLERLHESTACLIALKITQAFDEEAKKSVSQIIDKNNEARDMVEKS